MNQVVTERKRLAVYAIDDDVGEIEILRRCIQEIPGLDVELRHETDPKKALTDLDELEVDLIFLDYELGVRTGLDVLEELRGNGNLGPVIALTGRGDEYTAAKLTRAGADDYIVKDDLCADGLRRSIDYARAQHRRRVAEAKVLEHAQQLEETNRELEEAKRQVEIANVRLRELSNTDPLTGIANRRYLMTQCHREFSRINRHPSSLSMVMLDIDHFKKLNDSHGHLAGDEALKVVASALEASVRQYDLVARYGGEEFALLLPHTDSEAAMIVAERCRRAVESVSLRRQGDWIHITASAGVACCGPTDNITVEELISRADDALYEAKRAGRNRVILA